MFNLLGSPVAVGTNKRVKYAQIQTPTGVASVHIKTGTPLTVAKEAICHRLMDAAGLPVLPSYWVNCEKLPSFAVTSCGHGDLLFLLKAGNKSVGKTLLNWPLLAKAAVFDELIVNGDRNKGNLLWNGHGGFYLIDHEDALINTPFSNALLNVCIDQNQLGMIRHEGSNIGTLIDAKTIQNAVEWGRKFTEISVVQSNEISEILIYRISKIAAILDERIQEVAADENNQTDTRIPIPKFSSG